MRPLMLLVLSAMLACSTPKPAQPTSTPCAPSADYTRHDLGLVWLDAMGCERASTGAAVPETFFDPARRTIIFAHGWQNGSVATGYVPSLQDERYGVTQSLARDWAARGWNVGVFRWTQLADEAEVKDAEAKIWTTTGPRAMRWRKEDGTYGDAGSQVPVGERLAQDVASALGSARQPLWLAGHSLGNQVVASAASQLVARGVGVERLILLDPFWSKGGKTYLGSQWSGERVVALMRALSMGRTTIELYKTSNLNDLGLGDSNQPARAMANYYDVWPEYLDASDQKGRHDVSIFYYFASLASAPTACDDEAVALGARASPETLTRPESGVWTQRSGRDTFDPGDDCYAFSPL